MKEQLVNEILYGMAGCLNDRQLDELKIQLFMHLNQYEVEQRETALTVYDGSSEGILKKFLEAKVVERKSDGTVKYYGMLLHKFIYTIEKKVTEITTDDIRQYLYAYKKNRGINKTTMDNIRRILSSFFTWLRKNKYITDNPIELIERIKPDQTIKQCYSDEEITQLKDNCDNLRDLALIDFLNASMVRVGELVKLDRDDIDFEERKCIVFGKGSKEREVYIDGSAKVHLEEYLKSRDDDNPALFVSNKEPNTRLTIGGVQGALKKIGIRAAIKKVHPHRFRRTGATRQLNKGMPIEQVKTLLGHSKLDTTMIYLNINKSIVKATYQRLS